MFERFTKIPHTLDDVVEMKSIIEEMLIKIKRISNEYEIYQRWHMTYSMVPLNTLLMYLTALDPDITDTNPFKVTYRHADYYSFERKTTDMSEISTGLYINNEAGTHFEESNFPDARYLTTAQEFLKQTPQHFLRIFTVPSNNLLYVWTNKELTPDTLYKLYALEAGFYPSKDSLAIDFINCLIKDDAEGARKLLSDYLNSDVLMQKEYERFRQSLISNQRNKIRNLENKISDARASIDSYENTIATLAVNIREYSEELEFIKSQDSEDDHKLFFKHINKVPYIHSYELSGTTLTIYYIAPLIYFADYPAEKMIKSPRVSDDWKNILKIILGRKYELMTQCAIQFNTHTFQTASGGIVNKVDGILPHPHIARFHCFGNHRQAIGASAETADYIGALEQITQAVLNINFYDTCVIDEMLRTIDRSRASLATWRSTETGEMLTTLQVLERNDYYEEA